MPVLNEVESSLLLLHICVEGDMCIKCHKVLTYKTYHKRHQTFQQSEPRVFLLSLDQLGKLTLDREGKFLQPAEHSDRKAHQTVFLSYKGGNKREANSCILQLQQRILVM